jgi:hypothetical protein
MNRFSVVLTVFAVLLLVAFLTLACGSGSSENGRQLQSISVAKTQNGNQFQFVATGTFSGPPTTVTPLPVNWTDAATDPPFTYTLSIQPYVVNCVSSGLHQAVAFAPPDPNAPSVGTTTSIIRGGVGFVCP